MRIPMWIAALLGLIVPAFGLSCLHVTAGESLEARLPAAAAELSSLEMQADFDLMRRALEEAHTGLYRYVDKAEIDEVFSAQRAKLERPMNKRKFMAVLAEALAAIRCGHTSFKPDDETKAALEDARKFPFQVLIEGSRLMVAANHTPNDHSIRPGMEILEINGREATDILRHMAHFTGADGDIETSKRMTLQRGFPIYYWWLIDPAHEFVVKARDAAGETVVASVAGVTDADRETSQNPVNALMQTNLKNLEAPPENLSLRFIEDPEIALIRVRYFLGDDFPQWIENTFEILHNKGTQALIIDVRGNGGGDDMYGAMLVSYLGDAPFRYFDRIEIRTIEPSFKEYSDWPADLTDDLRDDVAPNPAGGYFMSTHRGVAEQAPGKYPFGGKVFVLTDGRTFSTAADFAAVTHHLHRAEFIGEETGGGYYGNNSGVQAILTLPHSGMGIRIPMNAYWNAVEGGAGVRRGTQPDHVVETKVADLLRGVDAQLEMALALADEAVNTGGH